MREGLNTEGSSIELQQWGPPWLTVEFGLYVLLVAVGALLRFYALGSQPLDEKEARLAFDAWRFYTGGAASIRGHSPLLFHGNVLLYGLFGASDGVARLLPALAGSAIVGLPYLLRSQLGRRGALVSAAILAFSPSFVFFSRQLQGDVIVAACGLLVLGGVFGYVEWRTPAYLYLLAGALALSIVAGGSSYGMLLALGGFLLGVWLYLRSRGQEGLPLWPGVGPVHSPPPTASGQVWLNVGGIFVAVVLLFSTGLLVNLQGLQAALDLLPAWLGQFRPVVEGETWNYYLSLLVVYELPALVFGVAGAWYLVRRDVFSTLLVCWSGVSLVLYSLMGAKPPSGVLQVLLPLTLLAGKSIGELLTKIRGGERRLWDGLVLLVSIPAVAYIVLQLGAFANPQDPGNPRYLILALMSLFFLVCVTLVSGAMSLDVRGTLRTGGLVLLLILSSLMLQATWRLNYHRPGSPLEPLERTPTSPDVRNLVKAVEDFSNQRERERHSIDVTVAGVEDALLSWYLRDFADVTFVSDASSSPSPVVIAPLGEALPLPEYRGARFRLQSSWQAERLAAHSLVGWYLYREALSPPVYRDLVMWVATEPQE